MASLITDPSNRSALFYSHPSGSERGPRSNGVVLRSTDLALSWGVWQEIGADDKGGSMFAYSNLNTMPAPGQKTGGRGGGGVHAHMALGLTYETGDTACTSAASACRIMFTSWVLGGAQTNAAGIV